MLVTWLVDILIYDSCSPSIHRSSMWVPGWIVSKTFLTTLLGYFIAGDCSIRVFQSFS